MAFLKIKELWNRIQDNKVEFFQILTFPDSDFLHKYRVSFLTGPAQKSSKYGTGPTNNEKMTKFTKDGKNPN